MMTLSPNLHLLTPFSILNTILNFKSTSSSHPLRIPIKSNDRVLCVGDSTLNSGQWTLLRDLLLQSGAGCVDLEMVDRLPDRKS